MHHSLHAYLPLSLGAWLSTCASAHNMRLSLAAHRSLFADFLKISDFGEAQLATEFTASSAGTAMFLAPEIALAQQVPSPYCQSYCRSAYCQSIYGHSSYPLFQCFADALLVVTLVTITLLTTRSAHNHCFCFASVMLLSRCHPRRLSLHSMSLCSLPLYLPDYVGLFAVALPN